MDWNSLWDVTHQFNAKVTAESQIAKELKSLLDSLAAVEKGYAEALKKFSGKASKLTKIKMKGTTPTLLESVRALPVRIQEMGEVHHTVAENISSIAGSLQSSCNAGEKERQAEYAEFLKKEKDFDTAINQVGKCNAAYFNERTRLEKNRESLSNAISDGLAMTKVQKIEKDLEDSELKAKVTLSTYMAKIEEARSARTVFYETQVPGFNEKFEKISGNMTQVLKETLDELGNVYGRCKDGHIELHDHVVADGALVHVEQDMRLFYEENIPEEKEPPMINFIPFEGDEEGVVGSPKSSKDRDIELYALFRVNRRLEGFKGNLYVTGRKLILEGTMHKISKGHNQERYFYLFNDVLIYGAIKRKGDGTFCVSFKGEIPLNMCLVRECMDSKMGSRRKETSFEVVSLDKMKVITLIADSPREKELWIEALQNNVGKALDIEMDREAKKSKVRLKRASFAAATRKASLEEARREEKRLQLEDTEAKLDLARKKAETAERRASDLESGMNEKVKVIIAERVSELEDDLARLEANAEVAVALERQKAQDALTRAEEAKFRVKELEEDVKLLEKIRREEELRLLSNQNESGDPLANEDTEQEKIALALELEEKAKEIARLEEKITGDEEFYRSQLTDLSDRAMKAKEDYSSSLHVIQEKEKYISEAEARLKSAEERVKKSMEHERGGEEVARLERKIRELEEREKERELERELEREREREKVREAEAAAALARVGGEDAAEDDIGMGGPPPPPPPAPPAPAPPPPPSFKAADPSVQQGMSLADMLQSTSLNKVEESSSGGGSSKSGGIDLEALRSVKLRHADSKGTKKKKEEKEPGSPFLNVQLKKASPAQGKKKTHEDTSKGFLKEVQLKKTPSRESVVKAIAKSEGKSSKKSEKKAKKKAKA